MTKFKFTITQKDYGYTLAVSGNRFENAGDWYVFCFDDISDVLSCIESIDKKGQEIIGQYISGGVVGKCSK